MACEHGDTKEAQLLRMFTIADVLHYERFHSGEVMAGNYILTNSAFSRKSRPG